MERDERGRVLSKRGRCPICKKTQTVLIDEDFDCCEPEEKEEEINEPMPKMVIIGNHDQAGFSVKDMIIAMIGLGWKDIEALHYELRTFGFDYCMRIDRETLDHILDELVDDMAIDILRDTNRVFRLEAE
jgi:hypothetical protein